MSFRALFVLVATLLIAWPADAQPIRIGAKAGGNFNQLSQPADPVGEPTVLFGTSFTGFGFQAGGSVWRDLAQLGVGPLFFTADLLIAHQRGTGYAESRTTPARRTVTIHSTSLRVPALIGVGFRGGSSLFNIGAGPELLLGLAAGSTTSQEGGAGVGGLLEVRPVTHVGLTAHLGMIFEIDRKLIPIDARLTWDPMVAKSTRDRFDSYVDFENPGKYAVAFNWQAMINVGWMFSLTKSAQDAPPGTPEPVDEPVKPEQQPEPEEPDFG